MFFWGFHVLTNQWLVGNQWLESPSFLVSTMPWTALTLHAKAGSDGSSFLFVPSAAFPVVFLLSWGVCIYVIYILLYYIIYIFINSYIQSLDIKNAIIYNPSIYIYIYICIYCSTMQRCGWRSQSTRSCYAPSEFSQPCAKRSNHCRSARRDWNWWSVWWVDY